MAVRLLWRLANPRPTFLGTHLVLRYVSEVMHVCLYVLLLIQPLAGILMSQAYGYPVVVFGWIEMPTLIWHSPSFGGIFRQWPPDRRHLPVVYPNAPNTAAHSHR